ncbi:hypothetical protein [Isoalcanivorax indicus]|uniref:hypothetical protein n=1 Tax=Isoalcanivorax indicus TaxID=2202653 RepID=UPI000DB94A98|nr:hypothetical protein [Isoalcanivorax indicus]
MAALLLCLPWGSALAQAMPERGMTQTQVERAFGPPNTRRPAVGQPPISRWVYDDFTVYFENNYTLHAVSHHAPRVPAVVSGPQTVDELPPIEEIDRDQQTPSARPKFQFDPATGQMRELDGDGQVKQEPASPPPAAEAPASAPEPATTEPAPAAPEPDTAAPQDDEPRFRFDPNTGRIVVDDPAATPQAQPQTAPEPAPQQPAPQPEPEPEPPAAQDAPEPAERDDQGAGDGGGFFIQW